MKLPDNWFPVRNSSNIGGFGYDAKKGELWVKFLKGGIYIYSGVPASVFVDMQSAKSKGSFVETEIKGNYQYRKVG